MGSHYLLHTVRSVVRRPGTLIIGGVMLLIAGALVTGCAGVKAAPEEARQDIIDRIVASSAKVVVEHGGRRVGSGSGVVIAARPEGPDGEAATFILTATHILEGWQRGQVFVSFPAAPPGQGKLPATVKHQAPSGELDLTVLEVRGVSLPAITCAEEEDIRLGEEILIVGFPWGKRLALFSGIVSQVPVGAGEETGAAEAPDQTLVVDAASSKGVSGGGVFRTATGTLLGIVEGYQTASIAVKEQARTFSVKVPMPGETFVVPIARVRRFLEEAGLAGMVNRAPSPPPANE